MSVRIINSDVIEGLRSLPDDSVQCVVTSPPYWGLRDYGVAGQIGLEPTPAAFVARMVEVFNEVRRVLRPDGVCFVNMGDSYASTQGSAGASLKSTLNTKPTAAKTAAQRDAGSWKRELAGMKSKDLVGIPWRVAFALQDSGWWLRGDYIWHKPNPMPESVTDRCTKAHEYIFHLTKSERYYWDQEAIKEPSICGDPRKPYAPGQVDNRGDGHARGGGKIRASVARGGFNGKTEELAADGRNAFRAIEDWRNKRSVWTIATSPFPEAHFATFPPELPEICIKAGSKPGDTILDPFSGAGTTALVADRLQRHAIGIELNPEYVAISERRIAGDRGGLLDIMEAAE